MATPKRLARPPARQVLATRMSPEGLAYITALAAKRKEPVSATMRTMLTYATRMPPDWNPPS